MGINTHFGVFESSCPDNTEQGSYSVEYYIYDENTEICGTKFYDMDVEGEHTESDLKDMAAKEIGIEVDDIIYIEKV